MDHVKYSVLREKWRRYFEDGQRDVFDTSSSEESDVKCRNPKQNKMCLELFRMLPTTESIDLNTNRLDIPVSPLSDENGVTTAITSGAVGLPEMAGDDTTVKSAQQQLEPMLEQSESEPEITADKSELQAHNDVESASIEFAQRYEHNTVYDMEPALEQPGSKLALNADISQLQDCNRKAPGIKPIRDTLSQWRPYLIRPFMHRHAQYEVNLEPILEESDIIQQLVLAELESPRHVEQKSQLETLEEEPRVEQESESESDDSYDEDYEDALSMDEEQLMIEAPSIFFTTGEHKTFIFNVLLCIAIYLRTMEGGVLEELLNYASFEDIVVLMFIFFTLLCLCKMYDFMKVEDETLEIVNDPAGNVLPIQDDEPSIRDDDLLADRNIQPVLDAPDAPQPMPSEQDMEME